MWERIFVILRKEFIQALREPRMRVLLFVPPMVQLIVFGFAVNLDVDHARIAWMDMDRTPDSRGLRDRFTGSGRFDIVSAPGSEEDVQRSLDRGEAQAVVRILPGFARDSTRPKKTAEGDDEKQQEPPAAQCRGFLPPLFRGLGTFSAR